MKLVTIKSVGRVGEPKDFVEFSVRSLRNKKIKVNFIAQESKGYWYVYRYDVPHNNIFMFEKYPPTRNKTQAESFACSEAMKFVSIYNSY